MEIVRIQLSLFVDSEKSTMIELIRSKFNPAQFELIRSHVTLCREDELGDIESVINNLTSLVHGPITVHFGKVTRSENGDGVLLPATEDNEEFHRLRREVLKGVIDEPGIHQPHITLMHPRNSKCTDEVFFLIQQFQLPEALTFNRISLIKQINGGRWNVLDEFS